MLISAILPRHPRPAGGDPKTALWPAAEVAGPGGVPVRITGPEANGRVHMLRALSDVIAVGIGTALADDPPADRAPAGAGGRLAGQAGASTPASRAMPLGSRLVRSA